MAHLQSSLASIVSRSQSLRWAVLLRVLLFLIPGIYGNAPTLATNFTKIDLRDQDFASFVYNAQLEGAMIEGADFTDVELRRDAQALLC